MTLVSLLTFSFANSALVPDCNGPDCKFPQLEQLVTNVINFIIIIAVVIAGIMIGYSGFLYITSSDNTSQRSKALSNIKKVFWGLVAILVAWLLIALVVRILVDPRTFGKLTEMFK